MEEEGRAVTEAHHPQAEQALVLVEDARFLEYLDATSSLANGWPHSRTTATRWLAREMDVDTITRCGTDPVAAAVLREVLARFDVWQKNEALDL